MTSQPMIIHYSDYVRTLGNRRCCNPANKQGSQGAQGVPGTSIVGAQGAQGAQGVAGTNSVGVNQTVYINRDSGQLFATAAGTNQLLVTSGQFVVPDGVGTAAYTLNYSFNIANANYTAGDYAVVYLENVSSVAVQGNVFTTDTSPPHPQYFSAPHNGFLTLSGTDVFTLPDNQTYRVYLELFTAAPYSPATLYGAFKLQSADNTGA